MNHHLLFVELSDGLAFPIDCVKKHQDGPFRALITYSVEDAIDLMLRLESLTILAINRPVGEVFSTFRNRFPGGRTVLLTALTMDEYASALSQREDTLIDHVVADYGASDWIVKDLDLTLQKLSGNDVFGPQKYLEKGTLFTHKKVRSSSCRKTLNDELFKFVETVKLGQRLAKAAASISEELLMNAIYDAPTNSAGLNIYAHTERSVSVSLKNEQFSTLSYGCDGRFLAISVSDPFGSFKKSKFHSYIKKVVRRHEGLSLIDQKKGGAGLGLFKILGVAHALICNSRQFEKTEMIALIDLEYNLRDFSKVSRSLHFFEVRGKVGD